MNRRPPDPNAIPTIAERARLVQANRVANVFFCRELLRGPKEWVGEHLVLRGAAEVPAPVSAWLVGYAPDSRSRLVDHLRSQGFDLETIRNAGLGDLNSQGRLVDRFRDQLMFSVKNEQLEPVGFMGMERSGQYVPSPPTQVHRASGCLVGIVEQLDLFDEGATPVLVNDPLDAIAVTRISRLTMGRWAGIPLFGAGLSDEQMRFLVRYAVTDTVIAVLPDDKAARRETAKSLKGLAGFYPRVQAVELPTGESPSSMAVVTGGLQRLHDALLMTRPLSDYRRTRLRRPTSAAPDWASTVTDPSQSADGPQPTL